MARHGIEQKGIEAERAGMDNQAKDRSERDETGRDGMDGQAKDRSERDEAGRDGTGRDG